VGKKGEELEEGGRLGKEGEKGVGDKREERRGDWRLEYLLTSGYWGNCCRKEIRRDFLMELP